MEGKIWFCKIGFAVDLPRQADQPMRKAVFEAFGEVAKLDPLFCFSGWGATLTENESAVVENRPPRPDAWATIRKQEQQELADLRAQLAAANAQRDDLTGLAKSLLEVWDHAIRNDWTPGDLRAHRTAAEALRKAIARAQSGQPARDWPEDAAHDNGQYQCICATCGTSFVGHKRRVWCKACDKGPFGINGQRDPDYPCDMFRNGKPSENNTCEGDGHYLCNECGHYRCDPPEESK